VSILHIYDIKTDMRVNPVGVSLKPEFSWKVESDQKGLMQESYNIIVTSNVHCIDTVWNSGEVKSSISCNIVYDGQPLEPCKRYYWYVILKYDNGQIAMSDIVWFETGLIGTDKSCWNNAEWITNPYNTVNGDSLADYEISAEFKIQDGDNACFAIAGRNTDNYVAIKIGREIVHIYDCTIDNDKTTSPSNLNVCGNKNGYKISKRAQPDNNDFSKIKINVSKDKMTLLLNGEKIISNEPDIIPPNITNKPGRQYMMLFGINQIKGCVLYKNINIKNSSENITYIDYSREPDRDVLSPLGRFEDDTLIVENEFNMINPVPTLNVRKEFVLQENKIARARLYASAMGFYDVFINGKKVNKTYYNPGFTDYRKRIYYQIYDVTEFFGKKKNKNKKKNTNIKHNIGACISKGYYSGFVGYSGDMVYGRKNAFICQLIIEYKNGEKDIIVTDNTWDCIPKSAVINADYQQGEYYDARCKIDWNDISDRKTIKCSVAEWPDEVKAANGSVNEKFELCNEDFDGAEIKEILKPEGLPEEDKSHKYIYDLGQNMVGTVRIKFKGKKGQIVKLRYGEMCRRDGRLYTENLRSAANTDIYVLNGDEDGEIFEPSFTSHGFRYIEVSLINDTLNDEKIKQLVLSVEGLVITNTREESGKFECSDKRINKLFSNIRWGQIGNSLLVFTDCPQRNERMGWTGDVQIFAKTAAYNMNIMPFMKKWLRDLRDAQKLYNLDGAVPDTAPLGGDNRKTGGCDGWGDAAAIVPWELYKMYGDKRFLEENYEMMKAWVDYQSREDRQNCGIRTVDGEEMTYQSDRSVEPFIQIQQSRGDHLAFDETTPFILSATAYAAHSAWILSRTAEILGKSEDADKYKTRFENIRKSFCEAWLEEDGSISYWGEMSNKNTDRDGKVINQTYYGNGYTSHASQTAYALALDFNLIPEEILYKTENYFNKSIEERDGKISTGFLGISHLLPALSNAGYKDTAFDLLRQEENPGWLYSVENGATTVWERWDSYIAETSKFGDPAMNSFNHYAYGAVGEWLYTNISGIISGENEGEVGFKKIYLKPCVYDGLKYAKGEYECVYGKIVSDWKVDGRKLIYKCVIPSNTSAVLYLPTVDGIIEGEENGYFMGIIEGNAVFLLKNGMYEFSSNIK